MNQALAFGLLLAGGVVLEAGLTGKGPGAVLQGKAGAVPTTGSTLSVAGVGTAVANATQVNAATGASSVGAGAPSIMRYLVANGLTPVAAAGVVGNLQQESSLNAATPGGGLAQWIGDRWTALVNFAAGRGLSPNSQQAQLEYLVTDLHGGYSSLLGQLNAAATPGAAAVLFSDIYERPGTPEIQNRVTYANSAFAGYTP